MGSAGATRKKWSYKPGSSDIYWGYVGTGSGSQRRSRSAPLITHLRACWKLQLEGRPLAERRLYPDAATVHLHDLFSDGETKAGTALGLGVGVVDLVKLFKDPWLMFQWDPRTRIDHADVEMAVLHLGGHAHLAGVCELDGVAHKVEEDLGQTLLIAEANGH